MYVISLSIISSTELLETRRLKAIFVACKGQKVKEKKPLRAF